MSGIGQIGRQVAGIVIGFLVISWILEQRQKNAGGGGNIRSPVTGRPARVVQNRPWLNA